MTNKTNQIDYNLADLINNALIIKGLSVSYNIEPAQLRLKIADAIADGITTLNQFEDYIKIKKNLRGELV